jgi:large subunit ribosomal protein L6
MSRVGKRPIEIPAGVDVKLSGDAVTVKGPLGELSMKVAPEVAVEVADNQVLVTRKSDDKRCIALHGTVRAVIANLVRGVSAGFSKSLEIVGTGYRAQLSGKALVLQVGYSHPVNYTPPEGIQIAVESPTRVVVKGIDRELVGKAAAAIRAVRGPEPYKGKGIRYEGEHVRRKAGKAGAVGQTK